MLDRIPHGAPRDLPWRCTSPLVICFLPVVDQIVALKIGWRGLGTVLRRTKGHALWDYCRRREGHNRQKVFSLLRLLDICLHILDSTPKNARFLYKIREI